MFAGRIGAIVMARRKKGERRRRPSEDEIEMLKQCDHRVIEDLDIKENSKAKLRFRKFPWIFWIMGALFLSGGFFCIYMIQEDLLTFHSYNNFIQWAVLAFLFILGYKFIETGKVETIIFDRRTDRIIIYKTSICCDRKIKSFNLSSIADIRAVWRGVQKNQVNTLHYKIVISFINHADISILPTHNIRRVQKQLLLILKFMGMYEEDLKIHDERTKLD
eukprot:403349505